MPKVTPSRQQYLDIKAQHPDAILFFRLGDFYETFDDDAQTAAKALDLVLTSRPIGKNTRVPMAGVPHHAAENYIARLITQGFKVALCEQIGSTPVNGLMPREVVRVFTAGTVIEPGMLDAGQHNYLAAIVVDGDQAGLAYADITTGDFATTQLASRRAIAEELARLAPAELLLPDNLADLTGLEQIKALSRLPAWRFELGNARQTLLNHFGVQSLDSFGCEHKPLATRAAGAVLYYLRETQRGGVAQIQRLATYQVDGYMALDSATRRNLELTESLTGARANSLLGVLNATITPMGARLLREQVTRPLLDLNRLNDRLDQVEAFHNDALFRADLRATLKGLPDLERLTNRVLSGRAIPRDLEQIGLVLAQVPALAELLATATGTALDPLLAALDPCSEAGGLIASGISEEAPTNFNNIGVIKPGFSAELDGVMAASAHARDWVAELEPRERERTGIGSLKVGFNKVFGYYLEVSRANSHYVPDDYIRKQTLTNAERYITPDLKEYETLILNAEERILEIERRLFTELCQELCRHASRLLATARTLAQLDVAAALAEVAANNGYIRPVLSEDSHLRINQGRHPVVERNLQLARFVPNSTAMLADNPIHIITGPNMSGKSTYLRQLALIALMAQIGSYVPAETAEIGIVDRIFTRIGAHDELHAGRSTFMVEMVETAEILHHATGRSLLILDEIGRGTSTYDGLSIAWAIVEYLHNHPRLKPRTLFATHYHELTSLADLLPLVKNYNVAVAEEGDNVVFLHQIVEGGADQSYGIHVAQLAGLPRDVILRANELLAELEAHAPTNAVEPSPLKPAQQMALFPAASPLLDELTALDVTTMTPLEAINKLYEWQRKYGGKD
ncbi:MAG: DNA mismatch repair protein MutS [Anaerolineales bacterium]|nr:DNA mismatch repair protein MutS [Anaerolineales bacterium]